MIRKVKWNHHMVLGDLILDFSKPDGGIYSTILLAGENGTGKTTILDTLSAFLNLGSANPFEYIEYEIDDMPYSLRPMESAPPGFHIRRNEQDGSEKEICSNKNNSPNQIDSDLEDIRHYGCVYSKARSGFSTKKVTTITGQQLDVSRYEDDSKEDFTSIKQLIIDIDTQDNSTWAEISRAGIEMPFSEFSKASKRYRFEQAFKSFFGNMELEKVDHSSTDEKRVLFNKNGKEISIDSLSTGEKQIVFRGAHLLKNSRSIENGMVLIDEPELSMHPKWQKKILEYYKKLFTQDEIQFAQMILATHSEYVLQSALSSPDDTLVIVLTETNGTISAKRITAPSVLPTITSAETNYLAFQVVSTDYHIELYGCLQNKIGLTSVKACDNYIVAQPQYDGTKHHKPYIHGTTTYQALPTFIRNSIDHPDPAHTFTQEELQTSIELLIDLCR